MMRRWWQLALLTWSANPGRTGAVVLSVALGVCVVVIVTNFFETARRALTEDVVKPLLGAAHIRVYPIGAHWGSLEASFADDLAKLDNVEHVTASLRRRARLVPLHAADQLIEKHWRHVDAIGITPETEGPFLSLPFLSGRIMSSGERGVAVVERPRAGATTFSLGDDILVTPYYGGPKMRFTVVGMFASQRVADFQQASVFLPLADLQDLTQSPGVVSAMDVMLRDPSPDALAASGEAVERLLAEKQTEQPCRVRTAAARQLVLSEAERITRMLLMLIALVAMFTSFFIILTTQSVSLALRRPQLGILRCVGLTRVQLAVLLVVELVPLGVVGTAAGVIGGIVLGNWIADVSTEGMMEVYLSPWCFYLAIGSGIITTLVSTLLLIVQVGRVSPLEAVNVSARPPRMLHVWMASGVGVVLLALHQLMAMTGNRTQWLDMGFATVGTASLYLGYVLLAPAVVVVLGRPFARGVGRMLGVGGRVAEDPFIRAPWRTTGACWVLMVGLSLIVYVAVRAESILKIWDFPGRLPSAFVWSRDYVKGDTIERVKDLPGVGATTFSTDVPCDISVSGSDESSVKDSVVESFLKKLTRPVFVAGEPEALLGMIKVAFTEGDRDDAMRKLKQGGYVLIPPETSRNQGLHVGDHVTVTVRGVSVEFEVAGVIESPAMDLAVTAFQAQSYMQLAAASAILGTREDLKEKFGLDVVSMFMCDITLPSAPIPPDFDVSRLPDPGMDEAVAEVALRWQPYLPNERDTLDRLRGDLARWREASKAGAGTLAGSSRVPPPAIRRDLQRFAKAIQRLKRSSLSRKRTDLQNWTSFRERLVLLKVAQAMDRPDAIMGSLQRLKREVDSLLTRALRIMTWLPSILLGVAAIGIANLMTVSVHQRTRQIAVLRAVGAQRSQVLRLVLAEAITIGLLGSVMGIALGLHEADSVNRIVAELTDVTLAFIVPVGTVGLGVLLTVGVCLLAGLAPARWASRNNIIAAIQTT